MNCLIVVAVLVLVSLTGYVNAANCGSAYINPGDTVAFYSNGYPYYYGSNYDCYWTLQTATDYRIIGTCSVESPVSPGSSTFVFNRRGQAYGTDDIQFAGSGTGTITSRGNLMSARITSASGGGRFYCTLTVKYAYCTDCGYHSVSVIYEEFPFKLNPSIINYI